MAKVILSAIIFMLLGINSLDAIIGGNDAFVDEFPFMAAIYARTSTAQFFCSGTLLNDQWILTSGQCVYNVVQFTIHLGSNTLNGSDPNRVTLSTSESVIHPEYDPIRYENDIGLIQLRIPITFTDYIKPIQTIMSSGLQNSFPVTVAGWGQTSDSLPGEANHLQSVLLFTLGTHICENTYGDYISVTHICGTGQYNEGTCIGDSGAPIFIKQFCAFCTGWQLAGIASFMSANGCESLDPSVFSRTDYFYDWIQSVIKA